MTNLQLKDQLSEDDLSLFITILESDNINYSGIAYDQSNLTISIENASLDELEKSYDNFLQELPKHLLRQKISQIKNECKRRIEDKYPDWMQRSISLNMAIKVSDLTDLQKKYKDMHPDYVKHSEELINSSNKLEEKLSKLNINQLQKFDVADDKNWSI
jgi:hypothetical protein